MTILVTGAAGFIGSHTSEKLLENGHLVIGIDNFDDFYEASTKKLNLEAATRNSNFTLTEGDIRDRQFLEQVFDSQTIDVVIHLAAKAGVRPSVLQPDLYHDVNVQGTRNLLEVASKFENIKFIFASSSSVYGESNKVPFCEFDPLDDPVSPYAATKVLGEKLCKEFGENHGLNYSILRFFSVYGPRQRPDMGIARFFKQLMHDHPITMYGDGSTRRDYTFIDDIVKGIIACVDQKAEGRIINLGNSEPIVLRDLISTMEAVVGKKGLIEYLDRKEGDVFQTYADISTATRLLSYKPSTDLKTGLEKQFEYLSEVQRD